MLYNSCDFLVVSCERALFAKPFKCCASLLLCSLYFQLLGLEMRIKELRVAFAEEGTHALRFARIWEAYWLLFYLLHSYCFPNNIVLLMQSSFFPLPPQAFKFFSPCHFDLFTEHGKSIFSCTWDVVFNWAIWKVYLGN